MRRRRFVIWSVVAVFVISAAVLFQNALGTWLAEVFWPARPVYSLTKEESDLLLENGWQRNLRECPPMRAVPFEIAAEPPVTGTAAITVENTSSSAIRNVWFFRDDMPNFYNAQTLAESVTAGRKTETEKVLALWKLFPRYYYNDYPLPVTGMLMDPPTLLAVLGTAQCNYAATALSTLCELAGCKTRLVGIELESADGTVEHCAMEAQADGKWIFMDPDGHAAYKRADGGWASAADLIHDASPVRAGPHAYIKPALLAKAFEKGTVSFYDGEEKDFPLARKQERPAEYSKFRHVMRYDLLPGEKMTLFPHQMGRCFQNAFRLYCNGWQEWTCRLCDFAGGRCDGLILENLDVSARGGALVLKPRHAFQPAALVVPFSSPYLMIGGKVMGEIEPLARDGAHVQLYALPFEEPRSPKDYGWLRVGEVSGVFCVSYDAVFTNYPVFGYALKLQIPREGVAVRSLEVLSQLQTSPRALPYLVQGPNRFTLYSEQPAALAPEDSDRAGKGVRFDNGLRIQITPARKTYPPAPVFPDGRAEALGGEDT